jgi:hypothetical protein
MLSRLTNLAHRHIAVNAPRHLAYDKNHTVVMTG